MVFLPEGTEVGFRQILKGLLGHLATSCWFLPPVARWLHRLRGVRFSIPNTVFIGRNVTLDNRYPELLTIGEDVWICTGCILLTHSYASLMQRRQLGMVEQKANLVIEDGAFIGAGSIILPGVRIGRGSYIAAGSVVSSDVPAETMVGGNPARVLKKLSL